MIRGRGVSRNRSLGQTQGRFYITPWPVNEYTKMKVSLYVELKKKIKMNMIND